MSHFKAVNGTASAECIKYLKGMKVHPSDKKMYQYACEDSQSSM